MGSWIYISGNCLASAGQAHRFEGCVLGTDASVDRWLNTGFDLVTTELRRVEKLWSVNEIVVKHGVHTLGWHFVATQLHVGRLVLIINRLESAEVLQDFLHCHQESSERCPIS